MLRNDQLDQWDRDHFIHPSTHLAQFARGELSHRVIKTGTAGTSRKRPRVTVFTLEIPSTTCMPSTTCPNTAYPQPWGLLVL